MRACLAETTLERFAACYFAYALLTGVGLDSSERAGDVYAIDDSAETHALVRDCSGSSSCGSRLQCIKGCRTCDSPCHIPCRTHADCVGQYVGVELAYHCSNLGNGYPGHCHWN